MLREITKEIQSQEETLRQGGGEAGRERQARLGRLTARERISHLIDPDTTFYEVGLWAAWGMYSEWGEFPAAGSVVGIGTVEGRSAMIVANDATVKAGAFVPQSVKKVIRAQKIAATFRLPVIYLVDSSGVFLPMQDEIFPDEDDFGRIFRNNSMMSAMGVPQYAAVMGNCIAGGGYLPVLCDTVLMTKGSHLCLAGPSLVKAAIGQTVDPEELSGATMHSSISGTADYHEPDDPSCLQKLRSLIAMLPEDQTEKNEDEIKTGVDPETLYEFGPEPYETRELISALVDSGSENEFKAKYGPTLITMFAKIGGHQVGIVANQKQPQRTGSGEQQIGGVIYNDSAEKAARFVMECDRSEVPIIFLQDVQGFMVGSRSEQSGIIKAGAKLVYAMSNCTVPKLTVVVGGSFGAGNYALCGKAYDPWLILAWPNARYAVMGADQAADTLLSLKIRDAKRSGVELTEEKREQLREETRLQYEEQTDIRYAAARGWVDAIISPEETRDWLKMALDNIPPQQDRGQNKLGMFQV